MLDAGRDRHDGGHALKLYGFREYDRGAKTKYRFVKEIMVEGSKA